MTAAQVVLWRHGRTRENDAGIWQGQLDTELDEVGRGQAVEAAGALAARLRDTGPVTLVASDLRRATVTADELAVRLGVEVHLDKRLREIDVGSWQALDRDGIVAAGMGADFDAWRRGDDIAAGGAERRSEAAARGALAVREHADECEGTLVVVSHGSVLRGATLLLVGLEVTAGRWLATLRNCHWAELAPRSGPWRLLSYNVGAGAESPSGSGATPIPG